MSKSANTGILKADQEFNLRGDRLPAIQLSEYRIYRGCNVYHKSTVVCQSIRFREPLNIIGTETAGGRFVQSFLNRFLGLKSFVPQNGLKEKFIDELTSARGVRLPKILLEAILAVETSIAYARCDLNTVSFAAIEKEGNQVNLIWSSPMPELSQAVAIVALTGLIELLPDEYFLEGSQPTSNFDKAFALLWGKAQHSRLTPSISVIKQAASQRGIPCEVLSREHLQLGQGKRQQQIGASLIGARLISAQKICSDSELINLRLVKLNLPVPQQLKVGTLKSALAAARKIALPVVIKPLQGKKGNAATVALASLEEVQTAFKQRHKKGLNVLLEKFISGDNFRLLIIGGKFVAAVKLQPPSIHGDGKLTVAGLIDGLNMQPYRDGLRGFPVIKNAALDQRLVQAGLAMDDVPEEGCRVVLHSSAKFSSGGITTDVTDMVHPDLGEMAERAASGVGLDSAGIDFITSDISQPYYKSGGAIISISARPELNIHTWPMIGQPRNVAAALLDNIFSAGVDGRTPVVVVAGDKGTGTTARMLDMILRGAGRTNALALREQAYISGEDAELTESQQMQASKLLLNNPSIDALVSAISLRETAKRGMLLDSCTVTVIMDRVKEGEAEHFYRGIDVVQRATTDCFVIAAGNVTALSRLSELGKRRIILVAERMNDPLLQTHISAGHEAVSTIWYEDKIHIVCLSGKQILAVIPFDMAAAGNGLGAKRRIKNATLFAIAAAFGLGLSGDEIKASIANAPGIIPDEADF